MLEIDVYEIDKVFGFVVFVETFVGKSLEECKRVFPNMIYMPIKEVG